MKRGFTLIELLAVIVILAIIALIATPIILGIINDTREESNERSVELYASAVRNAIAKQHLDGTKKSFAGTYTTLPFEVEYEGDVKCSKTEIYEDGNIYVEGCNINNGKKEYSYGTKKVCTLSDEDSNGKYSVGDIVICTFKESTEQFYVIENQDEDTTEGIDILSMYNLNVGDYSYLDGILGIQNENVFATKTGHKTYGNVVFSNTSYWSNGNYTPAGDSDYNYVYDSNSNLYSYVNAYENYLQENGVSSAIATLISYEKLEELGCSKSNWSCTSAPSWVYSTTYWSGSTFSSCCVWTVHSSGVFGYYGYDYYYHIGVRPLITISTSEIK